MRIRKRSARTGAALREQQGRLFWAWLFALPILLIHGASAAFGAPWPTPALRDLAFLVVAFPVIFVTGRPVLLSARRPRGVIGVFDLLVSIAAVGGYAAGMLALFSNLDGHAGIAAVLMASWLTIRHVAGL